MYERDYWVTVCDMCLTASCWHGVHMCQRSYEAGTVRIRASVLDAVSLEHRSNYSVPSLTSICGGVEFVRTREPPNKEECPRCGSTMVTKLRDATWDLYCQNCKLRYTPKLERI